MIPLLLQERTIALIRNLADEEGRSPQLVVEDAMTEYVSRHRCIDLERQKRAAQWENDPFDCQDEHDPRAEKGV